MIHINGRKPFTKSGYLEVGKAINSTKKHTDFQWLDKNGYPDEELLLPQRTVVQFNSTYMELTGRHDRIKGDATTWMLVFCGVGGYGIYYMTLMFLGLIKENETFMSIYVGLALLSLLMMMLFTTKVLLKETFTYTYFPIRFNRKTRKVYVRQANKKVETFNWDDLRFYMSTSKPEIDGADIKAVVLDSDGITVTKMFSFPFFSNIGASDLFGGIQLKQHFEFVRRYMDAETEEQLEEVKNAIRYTHPVHKKRETPYVSFQRALIFIHDDFRNLEYPKEAFNFVPVHLAVILPLWLRYIGRLIAINTSITPKFSKAIQAECTIDPNDKFDLDKYPPIGNVADKKSLLYILGFYLILFVSSIAMLLLTVGFIDSIGYAKGVEHKSLFKALLDILTLKWLF